MIILKKIKIKKIKKKTQTPITLNENKKIAMK